MEQKIYSIIIPHYNLPNLLRRLLTTIPRRDDLQVIVVDDCSTDGIVELNKLKQDFGWVEWYDTGTNGGGGKARNIGLEHAIGKYLIFADADDYFNLCFAEALDRYKDSNFDIIYFAANSVDTDTYQNTKRADFLSRLVSQSIESKNYDQLKFKISEPWAKFILRDIVQQNHIRFQESKISNDFMFSMVVDHYSTRISIDKNAIYCVTERMDSVSKLISPQKAFLRLEVDTNVYKFLRENNHPTQHKDYYIYTSIYPIFTSKNQELKDKALLICQKFGISKSEVLVKIWLMRVKQFIKSLLKDAFHY